MKLVIQRVDKAEVVDYATGETVGKIKKGLFVLLGVSKEDTAEDSLKLADKISKIRIMADKDDKMNLSPVESNAEILVVSQFTLIANTKDGNRPSFIDAAKPDIANKIYLDFIERLRSHKLKVETGKFGAYMKINANFDGPVTIIMS